MPWPSWPAVQPPKGGDHVGRVAVVLGWGLAAVEVDHDRHGQPVVVGDDGSSPPPGLDRGPGEGPVVPPLLGPQPGQDLDPGGLLGDLVVVAGAVAAGGSQHRGHRQRHLERLRQGSRAPQQPAGAALGADGGAAADATAGGVAGREAGRQQQPPAGGQAEPEGVSAREPHRCDRVSMASATTTPTTASTGVVKPTSSASGTESASWLGSSTAVRAMTRRPGSRAAGRRRAPRCPRRAFSWCSSQESGFLPAR
jgi:hypothetical protein